MKTLGKLKINSERILNNQELRTLQGGVNCCCVGTVGFVICGTAGNGTECQQMCSGYGYVWWG